MLRTIIAAACLIFSGYSYGKEYNIIVMEGAVTVDLPDTDTSNIKLSLRSGARGKLKENHKLINHGTHSKLYVIDPGETRLLLALDPYQHIAYSDIEKQFQSSGMDTFVTAFKKFFIYETEAFQGGKRLDDKQTLAGFPSGTLLMPKSALVIPVDHNMGEHYSRFLLFSGKQHSPSLTVNRIEEKISVPSRYLSHGKDYRWQVIKNGKTYSGYFKVANKTDQDNYEKEIRSIPHYSTLSPEGKLLLKAMKLKEWQFGYDMNVVASELLDHSMASVSGSARNSKTGEF